MKILAIETATIEVGVALVSEDGPLTAFAARPGRRHVEMLHPAIQTVMDGAGATFRDLDAVAINVGPGLFTGLRTGIAAAKALSMALRVPLVSAMTTEVLRRAGNLASGALVPVIDMRRGELAWDLPDAPGDLRLGPLSLLIEDCASLSGEVIVLGDGARRHFAVLDRAKPSPEVEIRVAGEAFGAPSAAILGELGLEKLLAGDVTDAATLQPVYLRGADVRIGWETRSDAQLTAFPANAEAEAEAYSHNEAPEPSHISREA